ncbi:putative hydrolase YxeP [Klebsiella pneumoniae]|uniref:M20/M25/M40 family metallo-hydrolase n=1 Tax=Klebsiella pneumoniae TaxID=573 RepID=UPI000F23EC1F|nr:M20/M25/M40 family metallo-hydrolase [Klebsiella pneumoniae]VCW17471.1 putative hydrolase YxeP [Klebsiella pneumoniae]
MGIEVHRDIGKTGVVGRLKCGDGKGVIAIRADIDAIQLTEQGDWSYRSMTAERMHGCGHDGHTCIALGAAQLLLQRQNFNGTVCFVFQPAEEPGYGARAMMDDGVIERFGIEIYGLHNMPGMKAGTIATRVGGIMASEDNFIIRIKGRRMRRGRIWRKIRWSLRRKSSGRQLFREMLIERASGHFLNCTDGIRNAIHARRNQRGYAQLCTGGADAARRMRAISEAICAMHGATCQFSYTHEFAPTVNWQQCVDVAVTAAINVVGAERWTATSHR